MEVSSHLTDYFLIQKALKAGFSHREFTVSFSRIPYIVVVAARA